MYAVSWIIVEVDDVNETIDNSNLERSGITYTAMTDKLFHIGRVMKCIHVFTHR